MPRCLLHNTQNCAREKGLAIASKDDRVRIVYGYDWSSQSDNPAWIYDEVNKLLNEVRPDFPSIDFKFESLGGKQGSIYCDICRQIQSADIALFDISSHNLNVIFELGLATGTGANVFILKSRHYPAQTRALSDLNGILEYRFTRGRGWLNFEANFRRSFKSKLRAAARRRMKTIAS